MVTPNNSVVAQRSSHSFQKHGTSLPATCLLCRVLWPRILEHRHLQLDSASEAKTLIATRIRPTNDNSC